MSGTDSALMESPNHGRVPVGSGDSVTAHLQVHGTIGRARGRSEDSGIVIPDDYYDIKLARSQPACRSPHHHLACPASTHPTPTFTSDLIQHIPIKVSQARATSPALLQHRQSMSVDSGVVMETDGLSVHEVSCSSSLYDSSDHSRYAEDSEDNQDTPSTPRSHFRLSGYNFSPHPPSSPTTAKMDEVLSSPDSESEDSDDSQGWDHVCIGQSAEQVHQPSTDSEIDQVRAEMEAVTLQAAPRLSPVPHRQSSLETIRETDDSSDTTLEPEGEVVSTEEADRILAFSLPTVRGISHGDVPDEVLEVCRSITYAYAERLASIVDNFHQLTTSTPTEHQDGAEGSPAGSSGYYSAGSHNPLQQQKNTGRGNRKQGPNKRRRVDENDNEDDEEDYGSVMDDPKDQVDEPCGGVKLRCIFRARNPMRFNVRDHTSCAMTMFTGKHKFSDLRKHVLNKHAMDLEAARCQKCKQAFLDKKALDYHLKKEHCDFRDDDPEDGITRDVAAKITFRGRECGPSDQEQWEHLWNLAFPEDTNVPSFNYIPVLEHHELTPRFMEKLQFLKPIVDEGTYLIVQNLFDSAIKELDHFGLKLSVNYKNLQGSRTARASTTRPAPRALQSNPNARDSGIGLDLEAGTPRTSARYSSVTISRPNSTTPPAQSFSMDHGGRGVSRPHLQSRPSFMPLQPAARSESMFQTYVGYPELLQSDINTFAQGFSGAVASHHSFQTSMGEVFHHQQATDDPAAAIYLPDAGVEGLSSSSLHHPATGQMDSINPADLHLFNSSAESQVPMTMQPAQDTSMENQTFASRVAGEYVRPLGGFI